jgi:mono/diheme cytochrome c family protein
MRPFVFGTALAIMVGWFGQAVVVPAAAAPDGKAIYMARCAMCHQANGQGAPGVYPPLAGAEIPNGPAAKHILIVLNGMSGPIKVKGKPYNAVMPPHKALLKDDEIAAVVTYERTSWGNKGGPVTAAQVKALRK